MTLKQFFARTIITIFSLSVVIITGVAFAMVMFHTKQPSILQIIVGTSPVLGIIGIAYLFSWAIANC